MKVMQRKGGGFIIAPFTNEPDGYATLGNNITVHGDGRLSLNMAVEAETVMDADDLTSDFEAAYHVARWLMMELALTDDEDVVWDRIQDRYGWMLEKGFQQ